MTVDPFTRWEELKQEFADTLAEMHDTAQDYEDTLHCLDVMEAEA